MKHIAGLFITSDHGHTGVLQNGDSFNSVMLMGIATRGWGMRHPGSKFWRGRSPRNRYFKEKFLNVYKVFRSSDSSEIKWAKSE